MDRVRAVIREVLERAPGSIRELAREAGISPTALQRVRDGDFRLSPKLLNRLADALERWGGTCRDLAAEVREVARSGEEENDGTQR